jgi:hypothetical protein
MIPQVVYTDGWKFSYLYYETDSILMSDRLVYEAVSECGSHKFKFYVPKSTIVSRYDVILAFKEFRKLVKRNSIIKNRKEQVLHYA